MAKKQLKKRMTKLERRIHNEKILQWSKWYSGMSIGCFFAGALGVGVSYMQDSRGDTSELWLGLAPDLWFGFLFALVMVSAARYFQHWSIEALDDLLSD